MAWRAVATLPTLWAACVEASVSRVLVVVGACGEPAFVLAEAGLVEGFAGGFQLHRQEDQ
jgi:hypothetical protein